MLPLTSQRGTQPSSENSDRAAKIALRQHTFMEFVLRLSSFGDWKCVSAVQKPAEVFYVTPKILRMVYLDLWMTNIFPTVSLWQIKENYI